MCLTVSVLENFDIYGCFAYIIHNDHTFTLFAPSFLGSIWKRFKTEAEAKLEFDRHFLYLFDPDYPPEWSDFFVPPGKGNFLPTNHKIADLKNSYYFFEEATQVYVLDCLRNHKRFRLVAISPASNRLVFGEYLESLDESIQAFDRNFGSNIFMMPYWSLNFPEIKPASEVDLNPLSPSPVGFISLSFIKKGND